MSLANNNNDRTLRLTKHTHSLSIMPMPFFNRKLESGVGVMAAQTEETTYVKSKCTGLFVYYVIVFMYFYIVL